MTSLPRLAPKVAGQSAPVVERSNVKEHSEEEWRAKRDLIYRLYIVDNRKLVDIMALLRDRYDFVATEQMYKKRLRKWNIRKRGYRTSARSPGTADAPSSPDPSPSVTECDGSDTSTPVEQTIEQPAEEIIEPLAQSETTSLSLACPSQPAQFAALELVLTSVYSWSQVRLDTPFTAADPMSMYLANPEEPPLQDSRTLYRTFELVFDLWQRGMGNLAGLAARKGFYALEYVLTVDHPDLLWHVLDIIYDMVEWGHLQLLGLFLQHAQTLARQQLPASHPLVQILQQLCRCDFQSEQGRQAVCNLLRTAWLRNVDMLSSHVGMADHKWLWLYEQLIWDGRSRLRRNSELSRTKETMTAALSGLAKGQGTADDKGDAEQLRIDALVLEFTQMDIGDKSQAEQLALQLLENTQGGDEVRSNARFHAYARKMLARLYEARGDLDGAEENLRWAILKREAAHGKNSDMRVIRDMWVLSKLFTSSGRLENAARVEQDAVARAESYLQDVPP